MLNGMKDMINAIIQKNNEKSHMHGGAMHEGAMHEGAMHGGAMHGGATTNLDKLADDLTEILKILAMKMVSSSDSDASSLIKESVDETAGSSALITDIKARINEILARGLGDDKIAEEIKEKIRSLLVGNVIIEELQRKIQDLLNSNSESILNEVKRKINSLVSSTQGGPGLPPGGPGMPILTPRVTEGPGMPILTPRVTEGPGMPILTPRVTEGPSGPNKPKIPKESLEEPNSMITRVDTVVDINNLSEQETPVINHVEVITLGSATTNAETIKNAN